MRESLFVYLNFLIVNSEKKEIRRFLCLYVYEEYFYLKRD